MNAKQFIELYGKARAASVAEKAGTKFSYFIQIASGHRRPSVGLAKKLVIASDNEMDFVSLLTSKSEAAA